ncbi:ATP-binding response regulator [Paraburkholderia caballeronis]|uniref:ATP-binding response regulator n=1 Tax=Paraburkholderia caballeronis TaxID=416943 RepID=UPI001065890F|nr:response regulator [Paraburkholderia caballeronis]TDV07113.1 signal transduction histidine kinase [Paraburkholderia caballeronis]TDV11257.1 signal transduction histidine kinase [Paraburkholderia caballeronis]TDV22442.1 signal transduction histidine kinase [Paraburkholderia caballeronis]
MTAALLILNVDDNEGARYVKTRVLRHAGYDVIEAATGAAALEAVRRDAPALVLLDVRLPDISGIDVCRQIKEDTATSTTLVLQTSAAAVQSYDKIRALDGGADSYLVEPVKPAELVANVRALLRLYKAEAALREADGRKDRFLATLAHELRNPLAPIRNAIELLDPKYGASETACADARLIANRQLAHLGRLVDDLLDVSRISHGKIALRMTALDLRTIVDAAVETSRHLIDAKQQTLTIVLPDTPCSVLGDGIRLAQVTGNLLSNAARYTPEHGHIELRLDCGDDRVTICIRDDGSGIAPDELPRVFDLFMQSRAAAGHADGGLGIGLALVRELAELHGGSVDAQSDGVDCGSAFTVTLPVLRTLADDGASAAPDALAGDGTHAVRRVLIADDNADAAASLLTLLELAGHEVRMAHDGAAALALAESFRPDVAILDIGLPQMDGYEVARALRTLPATAHTLLIALTGFGLDSDRQAASDAGFDRHFVKPAKFDEMLREIEGAPSA